MLNIKVMIKIIFRISIEKGHHSSAKEITWNITKRSNALFIDDDTWLIAIGNKNK